MAQYTRPTVGQAIQSGSFRVGKYTKVSAVTGEWYGTGSNAGGSAVLVAGSTTGQIDLIDGGTITAADIAGTGVVIEAQPTYVSASGTIYVLYGHSR